MQGQLEASIETVWARVRAELHKTVGDAAFQSWLQPLELLSCNEGVVRLTVPTRFMRDWVQQNYGTQIEELLCTEDERIETVEIVVQPPPRPQPKPGMEIPAEAPSANAEEMRVESVKAAAKARPAEQDMKRSDDGKDADTGAFVRASAANGRDSYDHSVMTATLDPRYTFDQFVVGKPNELAYAAARRVAESDEVTFNPLFLYGGVGLGKTHLMHAIAWDIQRRCPDRRMIYISGEKFMYQFIRALRTKDTVSFKEAFRSVDVLMIDDVQFIAGRDATQEEFFHTFNALVDQNRQVVISADKSPHDLEGMEERLRSRLGYGLVADIHPTTYELRLGILAAKAEQAPVHIPPKVLEFLAHRISSNVRELEGALTRIVAHATLVGRSITVESVQELLRDLLKANDRRVTIEEIQRRVAEHYNIKQSEMTSQRRARMVARPRQVAMYLSKQLTSRSLPEIGRRFGGRDHTTVMHAVKRVEKLCMEDHAFAEDIDLLRRMLDS